MTEIPGADYAWSHPGGAALQKAGIKFAPRYSSNDPSKDLTLAEAADLAAHGVSSVIVRESTAQRAGQGRAAGAADARAAVATATACQMPADRPLYFAVDYDADPAAVVPYFQGVASVIGLTRTGVYGGYKVVKYLLDHKLVTWSWQTRAWSGGLWDPRTTMRQGGFITINGVQCDANTAYFADYGQWTPGHGPTPPQEIDMTPAQEAKLDKLLALAEGPGNMAYRNQVADAASVKAGHGHIPDVYGRIVDTNEKVTTIADATGAVELTDVQVQAIADRMVANPAFATAIATAVVNLEAQRLDS